MQPGIEVSDRKSSADAERDSGAGCGPGPGAVQLPVLTVVELNPQQLVPDLHVAMALAEREASARLGDHMLLSWYDRDRDFESPQHSSECHMVSAVPGYVDYGVNHGATLKVDIEEGRFVFFYLPLQFPDGETAPQA
ncbi:MAG: AF1514 family protein [Acidiferrobacterales bacterium]